MTDRHAELSGAALDAALEPVAEALATARRVLVVTGAGISADSGMPTYRGVGGIYDRGVTDEGMPIEVALSGAVFERRPAVSWKYILEIERACRGAVPNRAHEVIAALDAGERETWVLTQNVDGLHRRAGSRRLIDIHGDVRSLVCTRCRAAEVVEDYRRFDGVALPPRCRRCDGVLRPAVVLFGELLPEDKLAELRALRSRGFDVVLSVGTTSAFPYVAGPVLEAQRLGLPTVEVNPGDTAVSAIVHHRVRAGAARAFGALARLLSLPGG
ncbi:MAG: NAD-dependent protein deacylase [Myxococcales bacterium]|nr:NAD-dependent protein deacylase [Myxococcales bacterium]